MFSWQTRTLLPSVKLLPVARVLHPVAVVAGAKADVNVLVAMPDTTVPETSVPNAVWVTLALLKTLL